MIKSLVLVIEPASSPSSFSVVHLLSHVWLFATPWTAACEASLSFTISLLKLISIELVLLSNHLCPLSPPSSPALNLSQPQGLFQRVGSSHQVVKSIGASALAQVLQMNIQGWFPLGLTALNSLLSTGLSWEAFPSLCVHAKSSLQLCLTLGYPMDCSLAVFSVHGILQARILLWVNL